MSSQRDDNSGAEGAVDGNTAQTVGSDSCALTDLNYRPEAWWRVDLNGTYAITELKFFLLNTELWRFRWYSIHVTDDLDNWKSSYCARDHDDGDGPDTSVVTLNCDAKGRYVTIWSDRRSVCHPFNVNYCAILQLCEVQVLGCNPGKYGRNCNPTCPVNCRDDLCSIDNGDCYGCKDGYIGNTCGIKNLALNKKTEMSSQRADDSGAEGAVDGNTAQTVESDSCALTDLNYRPEAWWRVDLNGTYAITELKIYLLNTDIYRFRFYSIHVSDDLDNWRSSYCTRDHLDPDGPSTSVVTLNCDAKGRYVSIWSDRRSVCQSGNVNHCAILQLCEVQVLVCSAGEYGFDCSKSCSINCLDSSDCDLFTGRCNGGCKPGWQGDLCNTSCQRERFGENCSFSCPLCEFGCHCVNGECLSLGASDTTHVSITPWVITGVACTITVLSILFNIFLCRRGQGQICSKAKHPTTASSASSDGKGAENQERSNTTENYEELKAAASQSNFYDSLGDGNVQYENTFRA